VRAKVMDKELGEDLVVGALVLDQLVPEVHHHQVLVVLYELLGNLEQLR